MGGNCWGHHEVMTAINPFITAPARKSHTVSNAAAVVAKTEVPDRPNYVSIYGSTIFAMTVIFLVGVGVPAAMAYGKAVGWGIGAFCAFWGGPSFGVMAASARVSA